MTLMQVALGPLFDYSKSLLTCNTELNASLASFKGLNQAVKYKMWCILKCTAFTYLFLGRNQVHC